LETIRSKLLGKRKAQSLASSDNSNCFHMIISFQELASILRVFADNAMINRNTFYLHYLDKADFLYKIAAKDTNKDFCKLRKSLFFWVDDDGLGSQLST
jgi:hypothetical protein